MSYIQAVDSEDTHLACLEMNDFTHAVNGTCQKWVQKTRTNATTTRMVDALYHCDYLLTYTLTVIKEDEELRRASENGW